MNSVQVVSQGYKLAKLQGAQQVREGAPSLACAPPPNNIEAPRPTGQEAWATRFHMHSRCGTAIYRTMRSLQKHREKLATALIEFHKSQCYFVLAIHTATLSLFTVYQQSYKIASFGSVSEIPLPLALAFCMSSIVPTTLTMVTIIKYARMTWHILFLTLPTFVLPTAAARGSAGSQTMSRPLVQLTACCVGVVRSSVARASATSMPGK